MEYMNNIVNALQLHSVEILINHKITYVVMRHYADAPIEVRRENYDIYFPPQYRDILKRRIS